ncbi:MAG: hypothetical protein WCY26_10495 [Thiohalobacteraceae bacterium]|nr:hypothetical protein [Gammaproteobacteria bacterium]
MTDEARKPPRWRAQALFNPASVFTSPEEVVEHPELTLTEKIRVLRSWEYDAAEIAVAEEEGMQGPDNDLLRRILLALAGLTPGQDVEYVAPTKQHGLL